MTTVDQAIADQGLTLPEVITGYVGGESVPVESNANQHAVTFREQENRSPRSKKMMRRP